jgi:dihydrolipoamide dehydrogenase
MKDGQIPVLRQREGIALGEASGFLNTLFDAVTGEPLGSHMIGAEGVELIQGFVIARQLEATEAEHMAMVVVHPTLSEMMHGSVLGACELATHI